MDYAILIGADRASGALQPGDIVARAVWQLGSVGLIVRRQSAAYAVPGEPDGAGPPITRVVVVVSSDLDPEEVFDRSRQVVAATDAAGGLTVSPIAAADAIYPDELTVARVADAGGAASVLPAPGLHKDAGLLGPLAEVWPDWRHPLLAMSAAELLAQLPPGAVHPVGQGEIAQNRRDVAE